MASSTGSGGVNGCAEYVRLVEKLLSRNKLSGKALT